MLLTFSTLPLCLLGLYLLHLPLFAVAEISFYDPAYPPDKLKTGNWSTDVSKPCRDALKQPIKACSPILFRFLEGGSTFMNTYYPRPNFTDENLGELCTPECRQGLEQWVENQHEQCTDEDDIINENDGWGGAQFLYLEPGFMMRYYWNWCLRDVKTKEFCLPNRAKYEGLPKIKACATEEVLSHICDDSCLKQSLAFFSSVGRLGFASDTYDWGGHGVRIPRVEELCPNANLTEEIEFTFYPGYRKPEPVCEGEIVSELYTVGPPDEPDVPSGVTISNGDSEEEPDDDLDSTDDDMDDSTDVDQDDSSADSTDVYGIPNRLKPTADTGYISGSSEEKSSAVQHLSMASLTIIGQISLLIIISIAI